MELRDALDHIAEIRLRMAETEVFRGYRAVPVALSGVLAVAAAVVQDQFVSDATSYVALWITVAGLSVVAAGLTMILRDRFGVASQTREVTWLAVGQFLPSLVAGGLLTLVVTRFVPEAVALLPGIWQVMFSLGLFASCRLLPRASVGVAAFYLASGCLTLALARGDAALSPWAMGLPFGVGQLFAAGVLYWTLERHDDTE